MSHTSIQATVEAPPGVKQNPGYVYQLLEPVTEEPGQSSKPEGPTEKADDSRGTVLPQLGSSDGPPSLVGCKHSATSAAPGSDRRPQRRALAADFSPTHFDKPISNAGFPMHAL
jgi:hypothetical protein